MNQITFGQFDLSQYDGCLVVTDCNVAKLYGISGDNVYLLPRGERAKSFYQAQKLCSWFLSKGLNKDGLVLSVGGGSVGDTVGFAASVYKRGVRILHVPTTLLAMIDSSVGGKTALDLDGVKNAVGTFYKADTLIDTRFLTTLNKRQLSNGYGELLKYRMLSQSVDSACGDGKGDILPVVRACVEYKSHLCEIDPFDTNERHRLNLGHTVGHAMELQLNLPHGVAVANGIYYETLLAFRLGLCSQAYADKWMQEVARQFTIYPLSHQIINNTLQDKKNNDGKVCFVLPEQFQSVAVSFEELNKLLLNA